jgi:hypothetical protein
MLHNCLVKVRHPVMKYCPFLRSANRVTLLVVAQFKAWVCSHWLAGTEGSNSAGNMDVSLETVVRCQVEVPVVSQSLIHRSPTGCSVSN